MAAKRSVQIAAIKCRSNKRKGLIISMLTRVGNVQFMQRLNRVKILEYIRNNGPVSRNELSAKTNLSLSAITNIINFLLERKLVLEVGRVDAEGAGRPAALIRFNACAHMIISVNIDQCGAVVAVTDLCGAIQRSREVGFAGGSSADDILGIIISGINELCENRRNVSAIGVCVSGHVRDGSGEVSSNTMRWHAVPVKERLQKEFGLPVYVANSSKTKAVWQLGCMDTPPGKNIIFLDLFGGVGIINIYDGRVNGAVAGELGHTTVIKDGPKCFCGNHGCLELVCSEEHLLSRYRELSPGFEGDFDAVIGAFSNGDEAARAVLKECAEYLGIGIANIISIFEPERILINGNRITSLQFVYDAMLREAVERGYHLMFQQVGIERVRITQEHALRGMSLWVADRLFSVDGPESFLG